MGGESDFHESNSVSYHNKQNVQLKNRNLYLSLKLCKANKANISQHSTQRKCIVFCIMHLYSTQYKLCWHKWLTVLKARDEGIEERGMHATCISGMPRLGTCKSPGISLEQHELSIHVSHK